MIRRRIAVRFVLQLAAAGALLTVLAIIIVIWMMNKLTDIEINRNFAPLGISRMISESDVDSRGLIVDPKLLRRLQEDGGWLQSLDEMGNVLQSFNAPNDLPARYIPGQLIDYWIGGEPFPYRLGLWIEEKNGHLYTLLYGARSQNEELIQRVINDGRVLDHQIVFADPTIQLLDKIKGWVQVLDREGKEIASWGRPKGSLTSYTLQELTMRAYNKETSGTSMDTKYDPKTGFTWVIQYPLNPNGNQAGEAPFIQSEMQVIWIGIAAFLLSSLFVFTMLSLWYANRFGTPILLILGWIQKLDQGEYAEYTSLKGKGNGRNHKGRWKRKYRIFGEIMESIHSLAATLQEGRNAAQQTQRNREEWIAGVTHDLKTPIASIQGYAHMLEAEKYNWSDEEVRRFASRIVEKTTYMDELINDLALTYRVRSGAVPIPLVKADLGRLLSESLQRAAAHPGYEGSQVRCSTPAKPVIADVHPPWIDRIVHNIVANALMHNPPGTRIDVELTELPDQGWRIDFRDNGQGMDPHTAERLFDRYYRGTNTDSAMEGSGLGMAVTKELVIAMGGLVEVVSERGRGTVISVIREIKHNLPNLS